ncbi:phospholipase-like protein [Tanacetum coccineum]
MSCRQVESLPEETDIVPFTYDINGHDIQFGRKEFCLATGLKFGVEYSECYLDGLMPFRRLLFQSDTDGTHITGDMLLDKIKSEEFNTLNDEDVVRVCLLAVLHMVLLGC